MKDHPKLSEGGLQVLGAALALRDRSVGDPHEANRRIAEHPDTPALIEMGLLRASTNRQEGLIPDGFRASRVEVEWIRPTSVAEELCAAHRAGLRPGSVEAQVLTCLNPRSWALPSEDGRLDNRRARSALSRLAVKGLAEAARWYGAPDCPWVWRSLEWGFDSSLIEDLIFGD